MTETVLKEADDWTPPQWLPINPAKTYFKLAALPPEEFKRRVLGFLQSCMTGERVAGSEADATIRAYNGRVQMKRDAGRKGGLAKAKHNPSIPLAPLEQPQSTTQAKGKQNLADKIIREEKRGDNTFLESVRTAGASAPARTREERPKPPPPKPKPPTPAEEAKALGYGVYAGVAGSVAAMLPKGITAAKLYAAAALKQLTPTELEKFAAHYSGRGWEFPTKREDKPRPITDANVGSAIASWALNQPNYEGGTNGNRNANRGRDRATGPVTQAQQYDEDPFS